MKKIYVSIFVIFFCSTAFCSIFSIKVKSDTAVLVMGPDGRIIVDENSEKPLTPASTLKILTASAALNLLGSDYRYKTEFYMGDDNNLYIKGYGDPLLISEVIESISVKVAEKITGRKVKDVVIDGTYFSESLIVPGVENNSTQPYDAVNGALCSNFNTVYFQKNKKGEFVSAEKQTPLLDFVLQRIIEKNFESGRIKLSSTESMLYTGHLFKYFLKKEGVSIKGKVRKLHDNEKSEKELLYDYRSIFTLSDIIKKLMEFSNNYTANQIFLTMGAEKSGPPAELFKGKDAVKEFIKEKGYKVEIIEGSGISRKNKISALELMKILKDFRKNYMLLKKEKNDFFKTGTMKNVSARAGFLKNKGKLFSYVIIVNGKNAYGRLSKIHGIIKKKLNSFI